MKILVFLFLVLALISQTKGNGHFVFSDEAVDKNFRLYSPLMFSVNTGYVYHQNVDYATTQESEIQYTNNIGFSFDADVYLFQGIYALISSTFSNTTETFYKIEKNSVTEDYLTRSQDYFIWAPYIGIKYYFRRDVNFKEPWFFSFGIGKNYFIGDEGSHRPSVLLELGKVTNIKFAKGQLYFSLSTMLHENRGFVPSYVSSSTGRTLLEPGLKTYISAKFTIGLHFNLMEGSIRF